MGCNLSAGFHLAGIYLCYTPHYDS